MRRWWPCDVCLMLSVHRCPVILPWRLTTTTSTDTCCATLVVQVWALCRRIGCCSPCAAAASSAASLCLPTPAATCLQQPPQPTPIVPHMTLHWAVRHRQVRNPASSCRLAWQAGRGGSICSASCLAQALPLELPRALAAVAPTRHTSRPLPLLSFWVVCCGPFWSRQGRPGWRGSAGSRRLCQHIWGE